MTKLSRASAVLALAASATVAGAASAETVYYYDDSAPTTYSYSPRVYYYDEPVIVRPAPRVYYQAPRYVVRSNTTYYYAPSNHDHYSLSSPGYVTTPAPYGYVPPGLSVNVGTGMYGPLYGGWNTYSNENVGGYDGYRTTTDR